MRQRIVGSHTPPCHRRMVITTLSSMFCLATLQRETWGGGKGDGGNVGQLPCCSQIETSTVSTNANVTGSNGTNINQPGPVLTYKF